MTDNDLITDEVVSTAERIEDMDSFEELEPLEVEIVSNLQGDVKEVVLVLTVGGPYIEVNATNDTVSGSWGGDTHTTHVNNEAVLDAADNHYTRLFEETR